MICFMNGKRFMDEKNQSYLGHRSLFLKTCKKKASIKEEMKKCKEEMSQKILVSFTTCLTFRFVHLLCYKSDFIDQLKVAFKSLWLNHKFNPYVKFSLVKHFYLIFLLIIIIFIAC